MIADTSDVGVEESELKRWKFSGEDCGVNREKRDCGTRIGKTKCVEKIHTETYNFVI